MQNKQHWERVYSTKAADAVSWFQQQATSSLQLIQQLNLDKCAQIIDVGAGASTLADDLSHQGYTGLSVLDLSGTALATAKKRLGDAAKQIQWWEADVTTAQWPQHQFALWHDRAVFHFFTEAADRAAYINNVLHALQPQGHLIIATFAEDGPSQCSGLPVVRYSAATLQAEFGAQFLLQQHHTELHHTPFGTTQKFVFCHFVKQA